MIIPSLIIMAISPFAIAYEAQTILGSVAKGETPDYWECFWLVIWTFNLFWNAALVL